MTVDNTFKPSEQSGGVAGPIVTMPPKVMREIEAGWINGLTAASKNNDALLENQGILGRMYFGPEDAELERTVLPQQELNPGLASSPYWWTPNLGNRLTVAQQEFAVAKMVATNEEIRSLIVRSGRLFPEGIAKAAALYNEGKLPLSPVHKETFSLFRIPSLRNLDLNAYAQNLGWRNFDKFKERGSEFLKEALIVSGSLADNPAFLSALSPNGQTIEKVTVAELLRSYSNGNPHRFTDLEIGALNLLAEGSGFGSIDSISLDSLAREMGQPTFPSFIAFWNEVASQVRQPR